MSRIYLHVPPEERALVEARGAQWDADTKCWYVESGEDVTGLSRWMGQGEDEEELDITSSNAHVAQTTISCRGCGALFEAICIHCETGEVSGQELSQFTVADIWAMDNGLAAQLRPWPAFRRMESGVDGPGDYANHCPHCGTPQEDRYLHSEPDDPFFSIPHAVSTGLVRLIPLTGTIRLGGAEHFEVE